MYLRAEKYVPGYEFTDPDDRKLYRELVERMGVEQAVDPNTPTATVSFTVAYWRKANAIHQWFVENCQDGVDECQTSYVSRDQLRELRGLAKQVLDNTTTVVGEVTTGYGLERGEDGEIVQVPLTAQGEVLADPAVAEELLPTQGGFFFGSTDYDQWYYDDLKSTVEQIDRALSLGEDWSFEYHSSW